MNSNYDARNTVWAVEQILKREWTDVVTSSSPLLGILQGGKGLNSNDFEIEGGKLSGTKMIIPIIATAGGASGITKANLYVQQTMSEVSSSQFTYAQYDYALYYDKLPIDYREREFLDGENSRGLDLLESKIQAMKAGFVNRLSTDLESNSTGSESKLMGIRFPLSTSQTVGGISQSANANWQSNVLSVSGAFSTTLLYKGLNLARRESVLYGREMPKIILATENASSQLYSTIINSTVGQTQIAQDAKSVNFGPPSVKFDGAEVFYYAGGANYELLFLDPDSWCFGGDEAPEPYQRGEIASNAGYETHSFFWKACLGCKSPKRNAVLTNVF